MAVFAHAGAWGSDNFNDPSTGLPVPSGTPVTVTLPGISTLAQLWNDRNRTVAVSNPTLVGANGNLRFYTDDPGDFDVHCNGQVLRVTATPFPGDTTGSSSGGLTADQVAAMLTGAAPITVSYSDVTSGGTGLVTISDSGSAGGSVNYNADSSVTASDGTDPPLDNTLATHAYANRGDDIVMTVRDLRYSSDESVQVAHTAGNPVDLPLPPSTVLGRAATGGIVAYPMSSLGGSGGGNTQTIYWNPGDTALLGTQVPFTINSSGDTVPASGWTKSIVSSVAPGGRSTIGARRLRLAPPTGLQGGGSRIVCPLVGRDSADSEIRSLWYAKSGPGQLGHMHRLTTNPITGRPWGYMVWHDITIGATNLLNLNTWTTTGSPVVLVQGTPGAPPDPNGSGNLALPGAEHRVTILASRRTGTTVVLSVPFGHGTKVGDTLMFNVNSDFTAPATNDFVIEGTLTTAVVTAVTETTVTYTSSTNLTTWDGGRGEFRNMSQVLPMWVASRMVGLTLRVKAWRMNSAEPDWADPTYAAAWTAVGSTGPGAGVVGSAAIYAGHMFADTDFCDYGTVTHTNLD